VGAVAADALVGSPTSRRTAWSVATLVVTLVPIGVAVLAAPGAGARPAAALTWLLFAGSSVHVGATAWFYTVAEVRAHMVRHPVRYIWVPLALVAGLAAVAVSLSAAQRAWLLLGFFAWQFVHFQKQNLGVAVLAARAHGSGALTALERRVLTVAGVGGVLGLVGHPALLQVAGARRFEWLFVAGAIVFGAACLTGVRCLLARPATGRPPVFVGVYLVSLLFFAPVWLFASPYAAVAGLTIAHGMQYLLLVGLVAAGSPSSHAARLSLLVLVNVALLVGLALNRMSHLHDAAAFGRLLFGAYLGLSSAHFVIDAGLWRLRDEFPREFLTRRLPYLLAIERV
jgi:hypothetical protein